MTNDNIIFNEVCTKYTAEEVHAMATAHFSAEKIAAVAAGVEIPDEGAELTAEQTAELVLVSDLFHTYDYWKKTGRNVKKGEKTAIKTRLWKFTNRPTAAQKKEAAEKGEEAEGDDRYYMTKAYLFYIDQTEKASAPAGRTPEQIAAYNEQLKRERRAAKLKKDFETAYTTLYNNPDAVEPEVYAKLIEEGDELITNHAEIVQELAAARHDAISSDREAAALALIVRTYNRKKC